MYASASLASSSAPAGSDKRCAKSGSPRRRGDYYTVAEIDALLTNYTLLTRLLTAGAGLTGGGTLEADRTFDVGSGLGIEVTANAVAMSLGQRSKNLPYVISGGLATLATGTYVGYRVPFDCTIVRVSLGLNQTGSIVVDIWKDSHANFPPVNGDSITASATPTISSGLTYEDATLTGWTTTLVTGDWLFFNVDSVTSAKTCSINLEVVVTN
jgi:hypothetical protein